MSDKKYIRYGDRTMELPAGMSLEEAKAQMARFFPELSEPKIETKKDGDKTTYVFSKQAGRKGSTKTPGFLKISDTEIINVAIQAGRKGSTKTPGFLKISDTELINVAMVTYVGFYPEYQGIPASISIWLTDGQGLEDDGELASVELSGAPAERVWAWFNASAEVIA